MGFEVFQRRRGVNMAAVAIEWKEPPIEAFENNYKGRTVAALKQRPGQWARLKKDQSSTSGKNVWVKLGCEALCHRTNPDQTPPRYDLYVRWPLPAAKPLGPAGQAAVAGKALIPPGSGSYLASRAARGVPPEGNSV
jgi:hypothetical protein